MPYRRNNYSFVVDSSFSPLSMQEMLVPFNAYKEEYEKREADYLDLIDKSDKFKYLSETLPEGSKARGIYENYAKDLKKMADDLGSKGLSMSNKRGLLGLKRRYQSEIGRLADADERMTEARKLRSQMIAKDPSALFAYNNYNIDDYLDNGSPSEYSISGDDLFKRGADLGKAISSREYSANDEGSILGGYYRKWVETLGVSPESIGSFMQRPEVLWAVRSDLAARGVYDNLSAADQKKAEQQMLNGLYNGIIYQVNTKPVRDENRLSAAQQDQSNRAWAEFNFEKNIQGYYKDKEDNYIYDPDRDILSARDVAKAKAIAEAKQAGAGTSGGSGRSSATKSPIAKKGVRYVWDGNDPEKDEKLAKNPNTPSIISDDDGTEYVGVPVKYDDLPQYAKDIVDAHVSDGNQDNYQYYFRPFKKGRFNDTEAALDIVPMSVVSDSPDAVIDLGMH